jgi:WD40 repeat protein
MKPVRSFLFVFVSTTFLFCQAGCSGVQPARSHQPTPDIFGIATQSAIAPTPKATVQPLPSPTNTVNVSQPTCFGKGLIEYSLWSPDGKIFAVETSIGIYLYDGATFQEIRFLDTGSPADSMAFSPDNQLLAIGGGKDLFKPTIQVWNISTGQLLQTSQMSIWSRVITFTSDGHLLAAAVNSDKGKKEVVVSDGKTGQKLYTLPGKQWVEDVSFSADGSLLMETTTEQILIWQTSTGLLEYILPISLNALAMPMLSPDNRTLAIVDASQSADKAHLDVFKLVNVQNREVLHTLSVKPDKAVAVVFDSQGNPLGVSASADSTHLWDIKNGQVLQTFASQLVYMNRFPVSGVILSPDGRALVIEGYRELSFWDVATGNKITEQTGFTNQIYSLAISPDGQKLAIGSRYSDLRVMDLNTHNILYTSNLYAPGDDKVLFRAIFSPDGRWLAITWANEFSSNPYTFISILDTQTGQLLSNLQGSFNGVEYNPNGETFAAFNSVQVQVMSVSNNQLLYTLNNKTGSPNYLSDIAFSPDGNILATAYGVDSKIKLWNAKTGELIRELSATAMNIAFHPNGHVLALTNTKLKPDSPKGNIQLVDIETGQVIWETETTIYGRPLFSADGQKIFSNSGEMWDASNGQLLNSLRSNISEYSFGAIAISPNNHLLATGGNNGRFCLWEIP